MVVEKRFYKTRPEARIRIKATRLIPEYSSNNVT